VKTWILAARKILIIALMVSACPLTTQAVFGSQWAPSDPRIEASREKLAPWLSAFDSKLKSKKQIAEINSIWLTDCPKLERAYCRVITKETGELDSVRMIQTTNSANLDELILKTVQEVFPFIVPPNNWVCLQGFAVVFELKEKKLTVSSTVQGRLIMGRIGEPFPIIKLPREPK
jgi:hypothetical protein